MEAKIDAVVREKGGGRDEEIGATDDRYAIMIYQPDTH
jgi:hypothetical protein